MTIKEKIQKYIWFILLIILLILLFWGFENNVFKYNKVIILEGYEKTLHYE